MSSLDPVEYRRALRQTLELYRLAGVDQFPRVAVTPPPPAAAPPPGAPAPPRASPPTGPTPWLLNRQANAGSAAPGPLGSSVSTPTVAATNRPAGPAAMPPLATPVFRPSPLLLPVNAPASTATRDERRGVLQQVEQEVRDCRLCPELATTRTQTVFGVGDPAARILFLGEAPGADEDTQGEPFVGRAGQLLNSIIEACRLKREEIYICNVLKCRPPGNRVPQLEECRNCRSYLDRQLATVDPDFIICWGTVAAQNLLQTAQAIGKLRRQFFRHGRARVLCTYHPSYLLRNPAAKKDVWEDMKLWRSEMGVDLNQKPGQA